MAAIWVESLGRSCERALDLLAATVRDCTDELWEMSMWQVPAMDPDHKFVDSDWNPITDPAQRRALAQRWVQRRSTPWSVAWHALEGLDYDLNGESGPWAPPPPFTGHPHWRDLPSLPAAWSAIRRARLHRILPPPGTGHAGRHDRREGRETTAAGSPLSWPAPRLDHHGHRGAHDRARVADPAIHH
jgi:hypothetical protein